MVWNVGLLSFLLLEFLDKENKINFNTKAKKELSGIFNFALEGLKELRQNKYNFVFSKACDKSKS